MKSKNKELLFKALEDYKKGVIFINPMWPQLVFESTGDLAEFTFKGEIPNITFWEKDGTPQIVYLNGAWSKIIKTPPTLQKTFLQIYKEIESGTLPSLVGRHFDSAEYADIMDLLVRKMTSTALPIEQVDRYVEYTNQFRTRKMKRFFTKELQNESNNF